MLTVIIVIHLMIVLGMIGVVLLQKSEGGGLVSTSNSGFMTGRGTANVLTRTTALLAVGFFITSLALSWLAGLGRHPASIINTGGGAPATQQAPARPAVVDGATEPNRPRHSRSIGRQFARKVRTGGASRAASTPVAIGQVMLKASTPAVSTIPPGGASLWHEDFVGRHCRCNAFRASATGYREYRSANCPFAARA